MARSKQHVKIIHCRNPHLWYRQEADLPNKDKKRFFEFEQAEDSRGIVIEGRGFVYHGDYRIFNKK